MGKIPWVRDSEHPIISYDIDVLSRHIFYTNNMGLFKFCWGKNWSWNSEFTMINTQFSTKTKIRFDNVGKILYISNTNGIYISVYPYTEFTAIIENAQISTFDIVSEMGYFFNL